MNSTMVGKILITIVAVLGLNIILCTLGSIFLAMQGKTIPESLIQMQQGSASALTTLLAGAGVYWMQQRSKVAESEEKEKEKQGVEEKRIG